jgi:uncharacterized membrane protein (UPF0127 family)
MMRVLILGFLLMVTGVGGLWAAESADADPAAQGWARPEDVMITTAKGDLAAFTVEIAVSEEEIRRGLMGRTSLADNAGMLFVFENARERAFWMHNTLISLDILFVDEDGKIVKIHENARPQDDTPLPSGAPVLGALEIRGGLAAALGIRAGDTVHHNLFGNVLDVQRQSP